MMPTSARYIYLTFSLIGIKHAVVKKRPGMGGWPSGYKVLDSPPQDGGFESHHTLGLLCLKSLGKICAPNVP